MIDSSLVHWQLRRGTANRKLGPGAWAVTIGRESCPLSCPFLGRGCYAESGPLRLTWDRVSRGDARTGIVGQGPDTLADAIDAVPRGILLRLGDAGDISFGLTFVPDSIDRAVRRAIQRGVSVIAYSHATGRLPYWVNRSTEGPHPDEPKGKGWGHPTVRVYASPEDIPDDKRIVRCPAEYADISCDRCRLCAKHWRHSIVAFTAHGTGKRRVREALNAP